MIVNLDKAGNATLTEADEFKKFAVHVDAVESEFALISQSSAPLVAFDDAQTAWVDVAGLKAFQEFGSPERIAAFDIMLAKAAPHGWVKADGSAIKSHVVWKV